MTLAVRPGRTDDLPFLDRLFQEFLGDPERTIYYPRFEQSNELLAELKMWGAELADVARVVTLDAQAVGFSGYLASPGDDDAYLIGPLLRQPHHQEKTLLAVLSLLELEGQVFQAVTSCLCETNLELLAAYRALGWNEKAGQLEMEWKRSRNEPRPQAPVNLLEPGHVRLEEVADVLGAGLGWQASPIKRVRTLLEEGYRVGYLLDQDQVSAAAVWVYLDATDFGRIEYLATSPSCRRRGLAGQLLDHILWHDLPAVAESAFVSVERDNQAAQGLYLAHGFELTHKAVMVTRPKTSGGAT
ncbi:MAG: GNAT family N-acetyltransferase [Vulcanimicrobiota bacterium]